MNFRDRLRKGTIKSPFSMRPKPEITPDSMWDMLSQIAEKVMNERMAIFEEQLQRKATKKEQELEDAIETLRATIPHLIDKTDSQIRSYILSRKIEIVGDKGEKGDKGDTVVGPKGERGADGVDGVAGKDGKDGKNGSPDSPEEVVRKVNKSETKINFKQIADLESMLNNLRRAIVESSANFGGHGGDAAGAFTILTATGTINDSNTVFTFSTTPSAVVVNGATYIHGHGVTIAGTTATLEFPPGTSDGSGGFNGHVYGIQ